MTARRSWKKAEQRVCEQLGGDRSTSPQQTSNAGTSADCANVPEYVEVKMQPDPTAHEHLSSLADTARRYGRHALAVYDAVDGPYWIAVWLDDYVDEWRMSDGTIALHLCDLHELLSSFAIRHEVGKRLPHRALVEDTIQQAREEGRPPLVVLQKKNSPRRVALVPLTTEVPA